MKNEMMKFTHEINIDGDIDIIVRDVNASVLNTGEVVYEYQEDNHTVLMRFIFHEDGLLVRLIGNDYIAVIPLELNEKTSGKYVINGKELIFDFILHKITVKSLAIYLEYDIFTKDSVISNNTWRIEVK